MASPTLHCTNKLRNQRILVIGGSTGIGYAVAEAAAEYGAGVVISSSNQAKLDRAAERLRGHIEAAGLPPAAVSGKACDLADPERLEGNVRGLLEFAARDGKLDHVVFTAGDALAIMPLADVSVADTHRAQMVRLTAPIIVAKHLPAYINASVHSSFTLTSGTMSSRPSRGWAVLAGFGVAVEGLTRGLTVDLKPVRVNCVCPGAVHTELLDMIPREKREAALRSMARDTVTGTVGTPGDAAEAYLYLMRSAFATGSVVTLDGGRMVGDSKDMDLTV